MAEKPAPRILVLDDEPFMLKLLSHMLAKLGFAQVTICGSAHAALEWFDSPGNYPDLILLDLNMPEMDGIEFVRHLVDLHYKGCLILISGEGERMLQAVVKLVQAHKISVLGHLHKPVTPEKLATLLDKWSPPSQSKPQIASKPYSADEVRAAIANGELVNYYQPKVAVATGCVVGVETLVRWHHPHDGVVFPGQFIAVAEAHGLIDDLTRVVLTGALAQTRVWQDAGLTLRVAINVSMGNLDSLDFADFVAGQVAMAGIPPHMVVLEVTESQLMEDPRVPLEIMTRLRMKRIRLSIDDFGTGHSSLAQLRDMPFDELKIDQSFVLGAWNNKTLRAMFDASLGLAKQLKMEAVAEGVEDQDDWDFLRKTECDIAQGFFIGKPMHAASLPDWINSWQIRLQKEFVTTP
ncbi:MAG: EAL domain-containing response regulator [Gallionella sp.]|nr:EAL domain-containing response regulator [Gallionella sp.]